MSALRIERELRLKDIEFLKLTEKGSGDVLCGILFTDLRRASNGEENTHVDEAENQKGNFIRIIILSDKPIGDELHDEITDIALGLLGRKEDCDWDINFEGVASESFEKLWRSKDRMLEYVSKVLERYGFLGGLSHIKTDQFRYLSQD